MATTSKKRRKFIVFSLIGLLILGLAAVAIFHKREPVITIQTEKVTRRNLTEIVVANGKIQPVVQVTISPEVSGEIIALPVKEGQAVKKGDLIVKIKPDFYVAARNQAEASYKGSLAGQATAEANLRKAEAEYRRNQGLYESKLVSDSAFDEVRAAYDVAVAQLKSAEHQVENSKASLASAEEELAKTTIVAPLSGTVSKLNSEVGERVLGTVQNAGTEIMTIADLNEMEARVDIGEMDVVLIQPGQTGHLEVDAYKDRKFSGTVTDIGNSSKGASSSLSSSMSSSSSSAAQDATKFEVRIRVKEKEAFRPGMSVTAEVETRSRTNVLTVPIASVTTRMPKPATNSPAGTNCVATGSNAPGSAIVVLAAGTNAVTPGATNISRSKAKEAAKPVEVVFVMNGDRVKMVPVKIGISDDSYWEITDGLQEGQEIISGGYRAISRDLEDGKKVKKGPAVADKKPADSSG
jgi:HlyD family secretion protein